MTLASTPDCAIPTQTALLVPEPSWLHGLDIFTEQILIVCPCGCSRVWNLAWKKTKEKKSLLSWNLYLMRNSNNYF